MVDGIGFYQNLSTIHLF